MPWGTDCLFETYSPLGIDPDSPRSVRVFGLIPNRLYQIPEARQRYAAEMKTLLAEHWDEDELLAETERIEAMVRPHLSRDQLYTVDFDSIRDFIRNRRSVVEPEINGEDMPIWTGGPGEPAVIDRGNSDEDDSLWAASRTGDIEQIKELLDKGADVNALEDGNMSALGFAAMANEIETMQFLLENGANPSIVGDDFNTPIHIAAFLGRVEAVNVLIEAGANINKINQDGATPYDTAAAPWSRDIEGIVDFISMFLEIDLDKNTVRDGRIRAAELIQEHGGESAYDSEWSDEGDIWMAAKEGEIEELNDLLDNGADPNALDTMGITPLSWAVIRGHQDAAELLLNRGADVNQPNRDGAIALHGAAFLGKTSLVEFLLANGANVNARNQAGQTALQSAADPWNEELEGMITFVGAILETKFDIEAVKEGRPKAAQLLRAASEN